MSKYPILFEANETEFKTHGIGVLSDAVQCDVTEEINGIFELNMVYPSSGKYLKELKNNRLIYADASRELGNQPFRICRVTKLLNGLVNVYAQHISYDLSGIQLPPFETLGTTDGLQKIKTYSTTKNDYSFSTTVISDANNAFSIKTPKSVRNYLLGDKDSFLQAYGGEFTFDRFNVQHSTLRGSDKGFRVKYGVNLVDLNQEESIEKTYTGIFPYYKDEYMFMDLTESYDLMYPHEVDTSKLSGKIMYAEGTFSHTKIESVDLSSYFEDAPFGTDELREVAQKYIINSGIGIPKVSLDVRFEILRNSPEYSNVIFLEDVALGDTIHVDFVKLGVSATARINSMIYDALRHKIKSVSIGSPKSNITDTLSSVTGTVKESEKVAFGFSQSIRKNAENLAKAVASIAKVEGKIPTKTSQLTNDSNFATTNQIPDVTGFATENFVKNEIAQAQLGGDSSEIDLSGYATKDDIKTVNTKLSNLAAQIPTKTSDLENDSDFATKEDISTATKDLATKEDVSKVEEEIPKNTSDLTNDSGYMTESEVEKLVDDKLSTIEVENGSVVYDRVVDEERKIYYAIDTNYLARNGSMSLKDQNTQEGLEIRSVMSTNGATFPLIIESNRAILEIVIVTQNNDKLTVIEPPRGSFENVRGSWVFTPLEGDDVTMVNIVSASNKDVIVQLLVITE